MNIAENSINYWKWLEFYKPISNHFDKTAAIDSCLFLPYGKQWGFVSQYNNNNIWTLIVTDLKDSDETLWEITSALCEHAGIFDNRSLLFRRHQHHLLIMQTDSF